MVYELDTRRTTYSNIDTGLRNNTVLAIMFDQDRNVWLALDNGLGYILHSSPYANLQGTNSHIGTGLCLYRLCWQALSGHWPGTLCDRLSAGQYPCSSYPTTAAWHVRAGVGARPDQRQPVLR